MEDRRKTLRDLEAAKAESLDLLGDLREKLGESLISRAESSDFFRNSKNETSLKDAGDNPFILLEDKKKLLVNIADADENIKNIEENLRRLGELEEEINRKEYEKNENIKALFPVYAELGRTVLTHSGFSQYAAAFIQEYNNITVKIEYQQKKLDELDNTDGNFFTRMTKGVRGMAARAMLSKNEADLEKFFRNVGERLLADLENPVSGRITREEISLTHEPSVVSQINKGKELRKTLESIKDETGRLRLERKKTADTLDQKGNPARRISELEIFITRTKDEICAIHRRFGSCAVSEEWKDYFSFESDTEKILCEKIISIEGSLKKTEKEIEAVKIAIAIDNEQAAIEKLKEAINEKQRRINDAREAIAEMESRIAIAEKTIAELMKKNEENQ